MIVKDVRKFHNFHRGGGGGGGVCLNMFVCSVSYRILCFGRGKLSSQREVNTAKHFSFICVVKENGGERGARGR